MGQTSKDKPVLTDHGVSLTFDPVNREFYVYRVTAEDASGQRVQVWPESPDTQPVLWKDAGKLECLRRVQDEGRP